MGSRETRHAVLLLSAALVGLVLASFWGTLDNRYVFDDGVYILDNGAIRAGLSFDTLRWALTSFYAANWHPLTWLSHALDIELYGLNPVGHHLTSMLLHALNAVLLMLVLRVITGSLWRSAAAAVLFAVHPLRVESVAWISERKDVLCGTFWLLGILAYVSYSRSPSLLRYLLVAALFALGLAAKPMVVTLPLVLLMLDYWPLGRFRGGRPSGRPGDRRDGTRLLAEKLPLIAMAAAASVLTLLAQHGWGAIGRMEAYPPGVRAANAAVAYVVYIRKALWPTDLAVYYPHPRDALLTWQVIASAFALAAATYLALRVRRSSPQVFIGWAWYLLTLLPVIGLVQVGTQAVADRYTYIPMIGLSIALLWPIPEPRTRLAQAALLLVGLLLTSGMVIKTREYTLYWRDDIALFSHALKVTPDNPVSEYALSRAYGVRGDYDRAMYHARRALKLNPADLDARIGLGAALTKKGDGLSAARELKRVIALDPRNVLAHINLAAAYETAGHCEQADAALREAVRIDAGETRRIIETFGLREQWPRLFCGQ